MNNKLCGRTPQYAPPIVTLTFDLESGARVMCDVGYLCTNFSLPRPLCSRLRPDVRDRQTDIRQTDVGEHYRLMRPPIRGGDIIIHKLEMIFTIFVPLCSGITTSF